MAIRKNQERHRPLVGIGFMSKQHRLAMVAGIASVFLGLYLCAGILRPGNPYAHYLAFYTAALFGLPLIILGLSSLWGIKKNRLRQSLGRGVLIVICLIPIALFGAWFEIVVAMTTPVEKPVMPKSMRTHDEHLDHSPKHLAK